MDVDKLEERTEGLVSFMRKEGYSKEYVRAVVSDIRWIERNGAPFASYVDACEARMEETRSHHIKKRRRLNFGIVRRYVEEGALPEHGVKHQLFRRGSYHRLIDPFREVIDLFAGAARAAGLDEKTVCSYSSSGSVFLLAMQELGRGSLDDVTEEDVMSHFTGDDGLPSRSCSYKKEVAAVLGYAGDERCGRVSAMLPCLRTSRKNVDFLRDGESSAVRDALSDEGLSLRDRAIASLMYYTGVRPVDISNMRLGDIDWEGDAIRLTQVKTGAPLTLPLTAAIGNPLYDYLAEGRPDTDDDHVFLALDAPRPITPGAVWHVARRLYDAAGVRVGDGRRRGTHLLRYNVGTTLVGSGVPMPVASAVLGHESPGSLDHYLFADVEHLRGCALDVSAYPVAEGVYGS